MDSARICKLHICALLSPYSSAVHIHPYVIEWKLPKIFTVWEIYNISTHNDKYDIISCNCYRNQLKQQPNAWFSMSHRFIQYCIGPWHKVECHSHEWKLPKIFTVWEINNISTHNDKYDIISCNCYRNHESWILLLS